jgi:23S rRNA pseudouridine2457 synthase
MKNAADVKDAKKYSYFLLYKPFGVLCQFTGEPGRKTLKDFGPFPLDVYPVGRLDTDSEGLILLTNDGHTKHLLLEPRHGHKRTYLVQVERVPSQTELQVLRTGVIIEGLKTRPASVELLQSDPDLPPRDVPIRFRKNVPTAWLQMTLQEGRNRQIRKMTASVGHPTLRLVRTAIGPLTLSGLKPGKGRTLSTSEILSLLSFANTPRPETMRS